MIQSPILEVLLAINLLGCTFPVTLSPKKKLGAFYSMATHD